MSYVQKCMELNDLQPAGIISADMAKAYKPHKELFENALEISGCKAKEVVHIGDPYNSDVIGAKSAGIEAILLNREGKPIKEAVKMIDSLLDLKI